MTEQSNKILLSANNLTKTFGNFTANEKVNFSILKGEIHALLGENGAGKSTFVKMIYGLLKPDDGEIYWNNNIINLSGPRHARDLGIGMVFQHFSLFDALTVLENISLAMPGNLDLFDLENKINNLSQEYGLQIDPNSRIYNLSVGEQQRVEIIRCLLQDPELLIMDEPTSVLTPQEISKLFDVLLKLSDKGCSILFITHKLEEVRSLTSRATILRRGANVGTVNTSDHTAKSLSQMMVGHEVIDTNSKTLKIDNSNSFLIKDLSRPAETQFSVSLKNINLKVNGGEILGIAGIAGNGQYELMETLIGEHLINDEEKIIFNSKDLTALKPNKRREEGISFIPEERIGHATVSSFNLSDNYYLTDYINKKSSNYGIINSSYNKLMAEKIIKNYDVRIPHDNPLANSLSGGNLQKFIVGREISRKPKLLIASQPTWGVDVGAALEIRSQIVNIAEKGSVVIIISQDLDEIYLLSDLISVIYNGNLSKQFKKEDISFEEVGLLMGGSSMGSK